MCEIDKAHPSFTLSHLKPEMLTSPVSQKNHCEDWERDHMVRCLRYIDTIGEDNNHYDLF